MPSILRFIIFISAVIVVYSFLNYYFIKKHNNIITAKRLPLIILRLVIITLVITPIATMIFSRSDIPILAAITGFAGYSWLAFLFLFLIIHGIVDIAVFLLEKTKMVKPKRIVKEAFVITLILSLSILIYGYYEATQIQVKTIEIVTDKLPGGAKKLRVVQVSDIHFSPIISTDMAKKVVKLVQSQNPDLIVSTGDLLDRAVRNYKEVTTIMSSLKAPMGKYAITGNHEYITGVEYSIKFTKAADFKILRNSSVDINGLITLVGVDDLTAIQHGIDVNKKEREALAQVNPKKYTILLKHQPKVQKESLKYFDLQLSGHTHAGQIFPFTLLVKLAFPYIKGLYDLGNGTRLYVNPGTGTWGPPIRFMACPEITVIDLVRSPSVKK